MRKINLKRTLAAGMVAMFAVFTSILFISYGVDAIKEVLKASLILAGGLLIINPLVKTIKEREIAYIFPFLCLYIAVDVWQYSGTVWSKLIIMVGALISAIIVNKLTVLMNN